MDLRSFRIYLKSEKRYSAHTIKAYESDLTQLHTFLHQSYEQDDVLSASSVQLRSWMVSLMESGIGARSINRKISSLRTYYRFEMRRGNLKTSPAGKLVVQKSEKRLPVFVTEAQMNDVLSETKSGSEFESAREGLIINLLYSTGLRVSELVGLNDTSIDRHGLSIKVLGKGNKERIIPVSSELMESVRHYQSLRNRQFEKGSDAALLVTNSGRRVYSRWVYSVVNSTLAKFTTLDKKSPHVLRHTFATHMLNKGAGLNAIKELLGHASLAATQVYTHNTIEKLKDIYKKAHPKA